MPPQTEPKSLAVMVPYLLDVAYSVPHSPRLTPIESTCTVRPVPTKLRFPNKAVDTTPGAGPAPLPETHHRTRMIVVAPSFPTLTVMDASQEQPSRGFKPPKSGRHHHPSARTASPDLSRLPPAPALHCRPKSQFTTEHSRCHVRRSGPNPSLPPPKKEAQTMIVNFHH